MPNQSRRVLVIGWDGADWKVASSLMDDGTMPNLQRLVDEGVMGNISTLFPVLSPMLWTSIATGKRAHKHGIHGFIEPDPRTGLLRPITNLGRKCKTIWNILSQNNRQCNVIGWWPSHPAEPINGVMVSNHFQAAVNHLDQPWPVRPGTIHPQRLSSQLSKFRVHPAEIEASQILPFVPKAAEIDQQKDRRLAGIAKVLAEASSVHAVATAVMQHEPWDFMGVYYDAIDHFCHGYMKYHPPREEWVDEKDFEVYKDVIKSAYQFHDIMLGALLALAGEETTVILLSDHGFHPDHLRPQMVGNEPAGPADEHRQFGILAIKGPGIKQDELAFGASLLDIAPTILALFDLPIGRDMDGRPILDAFEDAPEIEYIDSWELVPGDDGRHPPDVQVAPLDAHESLKQLVDLGYIERPDEDNEKAVAHAVRELRYNLARDYLDSREMADATREFAALWDEFPDESRFGVKLFTSYLASGNTEMAEATLERLIKEKQRYAQEAKNELHEIKEAHAKEGALHARTDPSAGEETESALADRKQGPGQLGLDQKAVHKMRKLARRAQVNTAAFAYFRGCLLHAKGEFKNALEVLEKAAGAQAYNQPSLRQKMGECYLGLGNWSQAKSEFRKILELDPINADAHLGLARCAHGQNRPRKAYAAACSALGLIYHNPQAHYLAGKALFQLGRVDEATTHLETALTQNQVFPECHRLLAKVCETRGNHDRASEHEQLANSAQQRLENFQAGQPLPEDTDLQLDIAMDQPIGIGTIGEPEMRDEYDSTSIIVVSGLPRSGTSMMMQMLAAGGIQVLADDHRPADASNRRGYFEFEPAKRLGRQNDWVEHAEGKAVKIVAQLLPNLPAGKSYRIIFMARPLAEIIASQATMLDRLGRPGARISDRQLAATYKQQIQTVSNVLARHARLSAMTVNYADAVFNPSVVSKCINEFLGGRLNEMAMTSVVDPAMHHERL